VDLLLGLPAPEFGYQVFGDGFGVGAVGVAGEVDGELGGPAAEVASGQGDVLDGGGAQYP
jgi:hypothetical protein